MDKSIIAQRIANKLFASENAIDSAISESAQLLGEMMEARREMGFSAVLGDDAAAKITAAIAALGEARTAVVGAHKELAEAKLRLGVRTRMISTGPKSYEDVAVGDRLDEKRLVG